MTLLPSPPAAVTAASSAVRARLGECVGSSSNSRRSLSILFTSSLTPSLALTSPSNASLPPVSAILGTRFASVASIGRDDKDDSDNEADADDDEDDVTANTASASLGKGRGGGEASSYSL